MENIYANLSSKEKREKELEVATKYVIDVSVARTILKDFGSVEAFLEAIESGNLTEKQKLFANKVISKGIDRDFGNNSKNFSLLVFSILGLNYCHRKDVKLFSSDLIRQVLKNLTPREEAVLITRFGLDSGEAKTLTYSAKEYDITRERVRQIEAKALRKLRHPQNIKPVEITSVYGVESDINYSEEELKRIKEIENILLNSPLVFAREDYSSIDIEQLRKLRVLIKELELIKKGRVEKMLSEKNKGITLDTKTEDLGLSIRSVNCLKRANLNCVRDIKPLSLEQLSGLRNMGLKFAEEVYKLMNSLDFKDEVVQIETLETETLEVPEVSANEPSLTDLLNERTALLKTKKDTLAKVVELESAIGVLDSQISAVYKIDEEAKKLERA